MVSEYLTPGGNLRLPANTPLHKQPCEPDGDRFTECTELFEPKEGEWWSSTHMVWQLENLAIPLFEACWPNHQAVFLFDNATNHTAFAHDALRVCVILCLYPATCSPKGHGSGSAAAEAAGSSCLQ